MCFWNASLRAWGHSEREGPLCPARRGDGRGRRGLSGCGGRGGRCREVPVSWPVTYAPHSGLLSSSLPPCPGSQAGDHTAPGSWRPCPGLCSRLPGAGKRWQARGRRCGSCDAGPSAHGEHGALVLLATVGERSGRRGEAPQTGCCPKRPPVQLRLICKPPSRCQDPSARPPGDQGSPVWSLSRLPPGALAKALCVRCSPMFRLRDPP